MIVIFAVAAPTSRSVHPLPGLSASRRSQPPREGIRGTVWVAGHGSLAPEPPGCQTRQRDVVGCRSGEPRRTGRRGRPSTGIPAPAPSDPREPGQPSQVAVHLDHISQLRFRRQAMLSVTEEGKLDTIPGVRGIESFVCLELSKPTYQWGTR